jgi:hypothetical protein
VPSTLVVANSGGAGGAAGGGVCANAVAVNAAAITVAAKPVFLIRDIISPPEFLAWFLAPPAWLQRRPVHAITLRGTNVPRLISNCNANSR